ncbi:hypothetical protein PFISCL1PPCAC_5231, partial [Pristionchus fissidentatus]
SRFILHCNNTHKIQQRRVEIAITKAPERRERAETAEVVGGIVDSVVPGELVGEVTVPVTGSTPPKTGVLQRVAMSVSGAYFATRSSRTDNEHTLQFGLHPRTNEVIGLMSSFSLA